VGTDEKTLNEIKAKPTVPIYPHIAWVYDVSKNKAYEIAHDGLKRDTGEFFRVGKTIRAVTFPLRRKLGIEGGAS
jgi:hypothetical protein